MKKSTILGSSLFMFVLIMNASYDSDKIGQRLANAAPRAFGSFRMFESAVNEQGLSEWNAAINEGISVVRQANKKRKESGEYINRIINANNDLINTVKGVYNVVFLPAMNESQIPASRMQSSWNYKQQAVVILERIQENIATFINNVKKSKLSEKETLIEMAHYISSHAQNAVASIDFKFSTEAKFKASIPQDRPWMFAR